ncbi:MAG: class II aldolase/adducin family protein [Gammaproteobacteria bacterium]|jgi:L-fuculose-phosphate aldolase|nr:class II aldolase/adducin family protein [Gammaproteobacteria bacterium]
MSAALREALCAASQTLERLGLNCGTAGNVSVRVEGGFIITPSGVKPGAQSAAAMVAMGLDGTVIDPRQQPSSEWRFHRDIYAVRADANAVVHVHSPYATALACQRRDIPGFHYMIAKAGGDSIRCSAYATFGTQALSDVALLALIDRRACLLANHGMIALGADLERALDMTREVEELAKQYLLASSSGVPILLSAAEMRDALQRFKTYGARDGQEQTSPSGG